MMDFYGYEIEFYDAVDSNVSIDYVLLNACLALDESRFSKKNWKKFSKKHPDLNLQSQRSLSELLDAINDAVDRALEEIGLGNVENAKEVLAEYNDLGVGMFRMVDVVEQMTLVRKFQNRNRRASAYECRYIAHSSIYLCVWIDW